MGVAGAIFYTGGGQYEHYVQAVLSGAADLVKNLRLRRVRTVNAGQSIVIAIDADSSLLYFDDDNWLKADPVSERFRLRVADAGTLTITASGGSIPYIGVFCRSAVDNCQNAILPNAPAPPGTAGDKSTRTQLSRSASRFPARWRRSVTRS